MHFTKSLELTSQLAILMLIYVHYGLTLDSSGCYNGYSYTWTLQRGRNAPGLTQQGGANSYTEESCKSACLAKTDCWSIDWNDQDKTCWHGTQINPSLTSNTPVNHWDLTRGATCTTTTVPVTTVPSNSGCTFLWTEYKGQNVRGLQLQGTANTYTEQTCMAACTENSSCLSIDYNIQDKTCWFGNIANPSRLNNSATNHYDLVRDCSSGCTYSWSTFTGMGAPGLVQQGSAGTYTRETCQQACIASSSCLSVDYNNQDRTCFHGTTANPSRTSNPAVDHFDLTRNCGGCTYSWSTFTGMGAPGLVQQGTTGTYTSETCRQACIASSSCLSVDYNNQDRTCFHGTTSNPSRTSNPAVDHFDLTRNCDCAGVNPYTWTLQPGRNAAGLSQQGGANSYTEESCKSACLAKTDCWSIDWNDQDKTCWHGTQSNPSLIANAAVTHWDLSRNNATCSTGTDLLSTTAAACTPDWTKYSGQNSPGLTQQGTNGQYTEETCKTACLSYTGCLSIDFNFQDLSCWFGTTQNPSRLTNAAINHWDLTSNCGNTCPYSIVVSTGMNSLGLQMQGSAGDYTEESCKATCISTPTCMSLDYNTQDKTCFFGTTQNPPKQTNSKVNHYDLTRSIC